MTLTLPIAAASATLICIFAGLPGNQLSFGNFGPMVHAQQSQPTAQPRPGQGQYQAQPALPQQQSQAQGQGPGQNVQMPRRNSQGPRGPRQGQQYDAHNVYSGMQQQPAGLQQPGYAAYNAYSMQQGYIGGYGAQQSNPNYYQNYQPQMLNGPQPRQNYPQQPARGPQQQQQQRGYSRPVSHNRSQGLQPQPHQAAVSPIPIGQINKPKTKALDIIDPSTHAKVEISPRSKLSVVLLLLACIARCIPHMT